MEEEVQQTEEGSTQEGMPKVYKYLIIGIVVAIVIIAGLFFLKLSSMKQTSELKDYGTNFESFVSQAKSCEPSKVLYNVSLDLMGLRTDTWIYEMKIKGIENDDCLFYMEIVNYTSNPAQEGLPPVDFFKSLNKTCNIPLDMVEKEFEYLKAGSPLAFSNKSYCIYAEQVTMTTGGQGTNNNACTESWTCSNWSICNGGTQTRTCTDSNNCGTTNNKPSLSKACQQEQTPPTSDECSGLPLWVQDSPNGVCTDSDNGKNYYIKGITSGPEWSENRRFQGEDVCGAYNWNSKILTENYCCNGFLYIEEYNCTNGCLAGACLSEGECKSNSDCNLNCENCVESTGICINKGGSIGSDPVNGEYDYRNYDIYYVCRGCEEDNDCKTGYKCDPFEGYTCQPNLETECNLAICENCLSGKRKYSSRGGFSVCYDCDTNADCKSGFNCIMAECVAI